MLFLLAVSLIVLGVFHARTVSRLDNAFNMLVENEVAQLKLIQQVTALTFSVNRNCLNLIITPTGGYVPETIVKIQKDIGRQRNALSALKRLKWSDPSLIDNLEQKINGYNASVNRFLQILSEHGTAPANDFRFTEMRPQMDQLNDAFGNLALSISNTSLAQNEKTSSTSLQTILIGLMLAGWPFFLAAILLIWGTVNFVRYISSSRPTD
jgi:hypothetical protein